MTMSIHSSFGKGTGMQRHRSVIKRYEKLETLQEKGIWDETRSVLGLPKVKMFKIKARKEKAKAEAEEKAEVSAEAGAEKPAAEKPAQAGSETKKEST